jgi:hypothetical protein
MSKHIKHFLPFLFQKEEWKMTLFSQWKTVVGGLSNKMRIEKIDQSTLFIGVYHAAWLQELHSLSHVLKRSINDYLGKDYITLIKFKHATKQEPSRTETVYKKNEDLVIYTEKVMLQANEKNALEKIKDKELQIVLHSFLTRCYYQKIQ